MVVVETAAIWRKRYSRDREWIVINVPYPTFCCFSPDGAQLSALKIYRKWKHKKHYFLSMYLFAIYQEPLGEKFHFVLPPPPLFHLKRVEKGGWLTFPVDFFVPQLCCQDSTHVKRLWKLSWHLFVYFKNPSFLFPHFFCWNENWCKIAKKENVRINDKAFWVSKIFFNSFNCPAVVLSVIISHLLHNFL